MIADAPWSSLKYVVIDVEGNGARPPELVELAVVPISDGQIGEPRTCLVQPPSPISWQARKVHGISTADLANQPTFADIAGDVRSALADHIPVGHNVRIDLDVMTRTLTTWSPREAFDTLRLARRTWKQPSHRLGALVEHRNLADGLPSELQPHRAAYDALVTARLFVDVATTGPAPLTLGALREAGGWTSLPQNPNPSCDCSTDGYAAPAAWSVHYHRGPERRR